MMLTVHRQRLERQCRAHIMFHRKRAQVRKCYWRSLRERYSPGLAHHVKVWRLVTHAPHSMRTAHDT